jgi:hypothetical protein
MSNAGIQDIKVRFISTEFADVDDKDNKLFKLLDEEESRISFDEEIFKQTKVLRYYDVPAGDYTFSLQGLNYKVPYNVGVKLHRPPANFTVRPVDTYQSQ